MDEQDEIYELKNFMAAYCGGSKCQSGSLNNCFWCIAKALYAAGYRNTTELSAEVRKDTAATIAADIMLLMVNNENVAAGEIIGHIAAKYAIKLSV